MAGDVLQLDGRSACFSVALPDDALIGRLSQLEVHPTGPLWGQGASMVTKDCFELEQACLEAYPQFRSGLENVNLKQERRALRAGAASMEWVWDGPSDLIFQFELPKGSYATSLLRELGQLESGNGVAPC